jgi:hypothetical protein
MSASEIIEQLKILPKNEFAQVVEFVHRVEYQARDTSPEMTDSELLLAARRAGSFNLMDAPGEDIYSAGN